MNHYNYQDRFKKLYDKSVLHYQAGRKDPSSWFEPAELEFIAANGWRVQDFFDYAEDQVRDGEPSYEIAQSIEQVRREYFLHMQGGKPSSHRLSSSEFPEKSAEFEGIKWLPRIIQKAKGKLKGELPKDTMYCCGGDRNFLSSHDIHPAEFLRLVWANMDDQQPILEFVQKRSPAVTA